MAKQRIRIRLKAYDHRLLDQSAAQIVETAQRTGADVVGPVPLPDAHREVHRPAVAVHRQGQPGAVRDPHPQAARRHPGPLVEDRRRPDATLAGGGRRHRDQDVMGDRIDRPQGRHDPGLPGRRHDGRRLAWSSIEPNTVTRLRTTERDGYTAVQLGTEVVKKLTKPEAGQLKDLPKVATHPRVPRRRRRRVRGRPDRRARRPVRRGRRWSTSPASRRARASPATSSATTSTAAPRPTAPTTIASPARSARAPRRVASTRA